MLKAEKKRKAIIKALSSKSLIIDPLFLEGVEDDDGSQDIIIEFERYIIKYKNNCGLKIDYNSSVIKKSENIGRIASYISKLSATKFEKFAALLVKIFGYEITHATKVSHDQGIDFIGVKKFQLFDSTRKSYIIGQAKKYTELVNIKEVREFAGSVLLLRNREFSQSKDVYSTIIMKSFTAVEGMFATSYFFSEHAVRLCENADIISLDFIDLVLLTEKAILEKSLEIERNNKFVKTKTDKVLNTITVIN